MVVGRDGIARVDDGFAGRATGRPSDGGPGPAFLDADVCYRALKARDARFDGWFFTGVTSTGIYCRPSCPSILPSRDRVRYYATAAAAQRAGFRACKRCRPDTSAGSPEWNRRGDVVGRAMRSINDGVVDRAGVAGLAGQLGYSPRQLHRLMVAEVGAGPLEVARAQRAETARLLLETTDLRVGEVAFAAGFGSVRQFNDTVRVVFGEPPMALRERARRRRRYDSRRASVEGAVARGTAERANHRRPPGRHGSRAGAVGPVSVSIRLAFRAPFPSQVLFAFLSERAVPGVEEGTADWYRRAFRLCHGVVVATVRDSGEGTLNCALQLDDLRDLTTAVRRVRQLFDLDADPAAVAEVLGGDPVLGAAVTALPGLRIPGHVDGNELAVRAVLGQQVSVAGARTLAGRLALEHGLPLAAPAGSVVREFPAPQVIAALSPGDLPMPGARATAVIRLAEELSSGRLSLEPGADREEISRQLLALPGIGPWTVSYVRMRALSDPDSFLAGDLGVRRALARLGEPAGERQALALSERWRPYRAYALQYLWSGAGAAGTAGASAVGVAPAGVAPVSVSGRAWPDSVAPAGAALV